MTRVYGAETADRETGADEPLPRRGRPRARRAWAMRRARSCSTAPTRPAQLVAHLKRDPVDLLVVGSHGHGLVRDLLLGQTVDKVRHGLEIPMLIARPDRRRRPRGRPCPAHRPGPGRHAQGPHLAAKSRNGSAQGPVG